GSGSSYERRSLVLRSALSLVPVDSSGSHDYSTRNAGTLASAGFRRYWRWQSRRREGRPTIEAELRALIRQMSTENVLWGAPRIHGELLKLGLRSRSRASPDTWSSGAVSQGW